MPYYDPAVVYGGWPYPAYPPYYLAAGYSPGGGLLATGLAFGAGYAVGRWAAAEAIGAAASTGATTTSISTVLMAATTGSTIPLTARA